ncbi:MAG: nicotinamide mononucleotide transporter [Ruminococcaceae bacterium]|nr:nicotinamide mononucleotide transporter [Oscillospiraceae bacterium]
MKLTEQIRGLTRGEFILWLCSAVGVAASFLLSGGGDIYTLIASLIGVTALIYVAKGYALGQLLTIIFAVFYGIISFFFRYYGEMITYLCMTAPIAAASMIAWIKNPYKDTNEVKVSRLKRSQICFVAVGAAVATAAFYFILSALGNAILLFSTISVTTSFIAATLTLFRSPYYAIGYAANDIVLIVLWSLATMESISYLPMVVCFVLFFVNDMYGFYNWRRMQKRQAVS